MKLNAAFGAGYKIYQNDVEQGFKEPCFFIAVLSLTFPRCRRTDS